MKAYERMFTSTARLLYWVIKRKHLALFFLPHTRIYPNAQTRMHYDLHRLIEKREALLKETEVGYLHLVEDRTELFVPPSRVHVAASLSFASSTSSPSSSSPAASKSPFLGRYSSHASSRSSLSPSSSSLSPPPSSSVSPSPSPSSPSKRSRDSGRQQATVAQCKRADGVTANSAHAGIGADADADALADADGGVAEADVKDAAYAGTSNGVSATSSTEAIHTSSDVSSLSSSSLRSGDGGRKVNDDHTPQRNKNELEKNSAEHDSDGDDDSGESNTFQWKACNAFEVRMSTRTLSLSATSPRARLRWLYMLSARIHRYDTRILSNGSSGGRALDRGSGSGHCGNLDAGSSVRRGSAGSTAGAGTCADAQTCIGSHRASTRQPLQYLPGQDDMVAFPFSFSLSPMFLFVSSDDTALINKGGGSNRKASHSDSVGDRGTCMISSRGRRQKNGNHGLIKVNPSTHVQLLITPPLLSEYEYVYSSFIASLVHAYNTKDRLYQDASLKRSALSNRSQGDTPITPLRPRHSSSSASSMSSSSLSKTTMADNERANTKQYSPPHASSPSSPFSSASSLISVYSPPPRFPYYKYRREYQYQHAQIATLIGHLLYRQLDIRDRCYHLSTYIDCFVGSEAVEYMLCYGLVASAKQAVRVGNLLVDLGTCLYICVPSPETPAWILCLVPKTVVHGRQIISHQPFAFVKPVCRCRTQDLGFQCFLLLHLCISMHLVVGPKAIISAQSTMQFPFCQYICLLYMHAYLYKLMRACVISCCVYIRYTCIYRFDRACREGPLLQG